MVAAASAPAAGPDSQARWLAHLASPSRLLVPAVYRCRLTHSRLGGVRHSFRHTVYLWLTDVDDLPSLRWPLTRLARFDPRDHLGAPDLSLRANLDAFLAAHGISLAGGRALMLAQPRALGPDRDGFNLVQLAVQPGPAVRLAGPCQRRPGGLERGHRQLGRDPDHIKILPGIVPVIGSTETEAQEKDAALEELIVHEHAQRRLAATLRIPVEQLSLDRQLPADLPGEDEIEGAKSRYTLIVDLARREKLTVRELIARLGGGRGHRTFTGTPEQVADAIEDWFAGGAADGFNIMPAVLPSGLELFVEYVVPILRSRGLFRREYSGRTLREHYGLPRPRNQHVTTARERLAS